MIIQQAFTGNNRLLKGGLHCHTTRSDGKGSPREVMLMHKEHGYDFLAITDHRRYNYENYAPETGITIIPGMEMDRGLDGMGDYGMCYHAVSIGPLKENGNGFDHDQVFDTGTVKDQYEFQKVLDFLHANNNLTIYCHPDWSRTPARSYENMKGNFAMEIWNSGCVIENDMDTNAWGWDELLVAGKRIYGVATDDGHKMDQHCVGWVMVNSENDVWSILKALESGRFYSSTGPEIRLFAIDGDEAVIETSPVREAVFINGTRPNRFVRAENGLITSARVKLQDKTKYIRATVVDEFGRRAWTNPIFID